ncbi:MULTISPECIES: aa3-type cytochrome oxidase subunit IV [unclassified Streptomyces]|uniref:aa3-type cytochrome oxidase subunit IV n=1 Tax=unclassified Streptomyces TaxID=2593676 RepID=UPI002E2C3165|nr:cytochrome c oxidase subunit 4 [Streptomyces sp. NBC_00223]
MKIEAYLFAGVAGFFLVTGGLYAWWSREPAGTSALAVAFLMASVISFFFATTHRRMGDRPEDRRDGVVAERAGPLDFFPARSPYPPAIAVGAALTVLGIVFGLWLFLLGLGTLIAGVLGTVFEFVHRGE